MRTLLSAIVLVLVGTTMLGQSGDERSAAPTTGRMPVPRFVTVDVFVDSGGAGLAAWQVEFTPKSGDKVTLVGIEGGEHAAYKDPAHYDPAALAPSGGGRVILAAFNTGKDLPTGRTRVARLHLYVESSAAEGADDSGSAASRPTSAGSRCHVDVKLVVAADAEGRAIDGAAATLSAAAGDEP